MDIWVGPSFRLPSVPRQHTPPAATLECSSSPCAAGSASPQPQRISWLGSSAAPPRLAPSSSWGCFCPQNQSWHCGFQRRASWGASAPRRVYLPAPELRASLHRRQNKTSGNCFSFPPRSRSGSFGIAPVFQASMSTCSLCFQPLRLYIHWVSQENEFCDIQCTFEIDCVVCIDFLQYLRTGCWLRPVNVETMQIIDLNHQANFSKDPMRIRIWFMLVKSPQNCNHSWVLHSISHDQSKVIIDALEHLRGNSVIM